MSSGVIIAHKQRGPMEQLTVVITAEKNVQIDTLNNAEWRNYIVKFINNVDL